MKITVEFRKQAIAQEDVPADGLHVEGAGVGVQEGELQIFPDIHKGDCRMIPLDLIASIRVEQEESDGKPDNVTSIRRGN